MSAGRGTMTAAAFQNGTVAAPAPLPTLVDAMEETLVGFSAYVRFECIEPEADRRRFYDLCWQPTLFGEGALVRTWGRLGRPGTTRASFYHDRDQALREIRQTIRRRLQHGYRVIDWH